MYLTFVKTAFVDAINQVFSTSFIPSDYRGIRSSIEYPMDKQAFPSLWINYEDQDTLSIAGIDHTEYVTDNDGGEHEVTRWTFAGELTVTVAALSSRERDDIYDQFVRVFAFSRKEGAAVEFRAMIEDNDFVALEVNWDQLRPHGDGASPGTPWGTDNDVIYEKSVGFDVKGEFVSDPMTNDVVYLSQVIMVVRNEDDPEADPYSLSVPPDM